MAVSRSLPPLPERIDFIADLMRKMLYKRGETPRELAAKWGCTKNVVERSAAEASRLTAREVQEPKVAQGTAATHCLAAMARALDHNDFSAVARCADVMTRILGARAPDKIEIGTAMLAYEAMTTEDKLVWLDARIAGAMVEKARLLAALPPKPINV